MGVFFGAKVKIIYHCITIVNIYASLFVGLKSKPLKMLPTVRVQKGLGLQSHKKEKLFNLCDALSRLLDRSPSPKEADNKRGWDFSPTMRQKLHLLLYTQKTGQKSLLRKFYYTKLLISNF